MPLDPFDPKTGRHKLFLDYRSDPTVQKVLDHKVAPSLPYKSLEESLREFSRYHQKGGRYRARVSPEFHQRFNEVLGTPEDKGKPLRIYTARLNPAHMEYLYAKAKDHLFKGRDKLGPENFREFWQSPVGITMARDEERRRLTSFLDISKKIFQETPHGLSIFPTQEAAFQSLPDSIGHNSFLPTNRATYETMLGLMPSNPGLISVPASVYQVSYPEGIPPTIADMHAQRAQDQLPYLRFRAPGSGTYPYTTQQEIMNAFKARNLIGTVHNVSDMMGDGLRLGGVEKASHVGDIIPRGFQYAPGTGALELDRGNPEDINTKLSRLLGITICADNEIWDKRMSEGSSEYTAPPAIQESFGSEPWFRIFPSDSTRHSAKYSKDDSKTAVVHADSSYDPRLYAPQYPPVRFSHFRPSPPDYNIPSSISDESRLPIWDVNGFDVKSHMQDWFGQARRDPMGEWKRDFGQPQGAKRGGRISKNLPHPYGLSRLGMGRRNAINPALLELMVSKKKKVI